ncbi:hypothetical protein WA026_013597 [Henosepilachna vigintioctopunctata]|uniref:Uncharacterized protein n=1 Tax=Henosepilachna vigintioctopunctata TaxID=420089 RepID=A0AAW1VFD4_9CUCU
MDIMQDSRRSAEIVKDNIAYLTREGYDVQNFLSHLHTTLTAQIENTEKMTTIRTVEDDDFKVLKKTARKSNQSTQDAKTITISNKFQRLTTEKEMDIETTQKKMLI